MASGDNSSSNSETRWDGDSTQPFDPDAQSTIPHLPREAAFARLSENQQMGYYRLIRPLGRGGFGEVWEAENIHTDRRLALKVLTQMRAGNPEVLERFRKEGQLAASLNHPRCVYVFGAEEISGRPAISMELMTGGTLQDRLHAEGRLSPSSAVDAILDIIEGLEAAHQAGIVHRDVKPSNCFVGEDGRSKIGDFGISKTLDLVDMATVEGVFVGTPAFASPEQARGRDVDFRSDIYSVGATLYALLTGKPPFTAKDAGELFARLVSENPAPFSQHKVTAPKGLERIVLRCMAKNPEKRYAGLKELRAALLPFSSLQTVKTGSLTLRFFAFVIDEFIVSEIAVVLLSRLFSATDISILAMWRFGYYFGTERVFGRSLGKYLTGLRVTNRVGAAPGTLRLFVRTALFVVLIWIFADATSVVGMAPRVPFFELISLWIILLTMRRRNGFAAFHELLSGTRVMTSHRQAVEPLEIPLITRLVPQGEPVPSQTFGPYRVVRDIWRSSTEALILAFDDTLRRSVWIHTATAGRNRPVSELTAIRAGRLRWLHGSRPEALDWDAYEVPAGLSLEEWVRSRKRLDWAEMRTVLLGLAVELRARLAGIQAVPIGISLRHIWIDSLGQPRLLEFPARAVESWNDYGIMEVTPENARTFAHYVLMFGLTGSVTPLEKLASRVPEAPLPEHAKSLVSQICDAGSGLTLADLEMRIRDSFTRPAAVTRARKVRMVLALAALPLILIGAIFFGELVQRMNQSDWQWDIANLRLYELTLSNLEGMPDYPEVRARKEAIHKVLAWANNKARQSDDGDLMLADLRPLSLELLNRASRDYGSVTNDEILRARRIIGGAPTFSWIRSDRARVFAFFYSVGVFAPFALAASFLLCRSPAVALFGFSLQTERGQKAGRLRCLARGIIAWFPFFCFVPLAFLQRSLPSEYGPESNMVLGLIALMGSLALIQVVYSIARPARSISDVLAGTYLVPK